MSGSPLDPLVDLLTSLALTIGATAVVSGKKTSMSVRCVWTGFSTSVTGLRGSFQTRRARPMTP